MLLSINHPSFFMLWLPWLVGLQGVPHTGALRTAFLLVGIGHLAWLQNKRQRQLPELGGKLDIMIFGGLLLWLVMQSLVQSTTPLATIQALIEDWGKLMLMMFVGVWASRLAPNRKWLIYALFCGAFLHVISTLGMQAVSLIEGQGLAFQRSLIAEYPLAATFTTMSMAWLLADIVAHVLMGHRIFPWPIWGSAILCGLAFIAEVVLKAKSAQLMTLFLVVCVMLFLYSGSKLGRGAKLRLAVASIGLIGILFGVGHERWAGMWVSIEEARSGSVPVQALVTDDVKIPANTDHSFYLRALRAITGIQGISENPWGIGYGADVFRRYVNSRYGIDDAIPSSNSGFIDFALATGVLGASLLAMLSGILVRRGWLAYKSGRAEGLALALLVVNQIGVYILDGTLGGSRFNGFALVAGVLWAISVMKINAKK